MATLKSPDPGLIFASILFQPQKITIEDVKSLWSGRYSYDGEFSPDFNPSTNYYSKEMGTGLRRLIIWDNRAFPREELVQGKLWADQIEQANLNCGNRTINIDIGLVLKEQVLLSTSKPYAHRIYLSEGVHAELTYKYENKSYHFLPWTYPDYRHEEKVELFKSLRKRLF